MLRGPVRNAAMVRGNESGGSHRGNPFQGENVGTGKKGKKGVFWGSFRGKKRIKKKLFGIVVVKTVKQTFGGNIHKPEKRPTCLHHADSSSYQPTSRQCESCTPSCSPPGMGTTHELSGHSTQPFFVSAIHSTQLKPIFFGHPLNSTQLN